MKIKILIAMSIITIMTTGCNGCRNNWKHFKSNTVGIGRTVTLYNANGGVIKSWEIDSKVEDKGGTCQFLNNKGKSATISGTFIIEEK